LGIFFPPKRILYNYSVVLQNSCTYYNYHHPNTQYAIPPIRAPPTNPAAPPIPTPAKVPAYGTTEPAAHLK
jgi:hypothetical protein